MTTRRPVIGAGSRRPSDRGVPPYPPRSPRPGCPARVGLRCGRQVRGNAQHRGDLGERDAGYDDGASLGGGRNRRPGPSAGTFGVSPAGVRPGDPRRRRTDSVPRISGDRRHLHLGRPAVYLHLPRAHRKPDAHREGLRTLASGSASFRATLRHTKDAHRLVGLETFGLPSFETEDGIVLFLQGRQDPHRGRQPAVARSPRRSLTSRRGLRRRGRRHRLLERVTT